MAVSEALYQQVALADPEGHWELVCGRLREKPAMTQEHNQVARLLAVQLIRQLDERRFVVSTNVGRLRIASGNNYIPDVYVFPHEYMAPAAARPGTFETYSEPVLLVAEVWSPSTGAYDVDTKIPEYKARGDVEIWRIHPYDRTLIAWRRLSDGSYSESRYSGGAVALEALPDVSIDFDALFE